jgi:hypothetical protein
MLVVQLPGDPKNRAAEDPDAAKAAVDADGNDEAAFPNVEDAEATESEAPGLTEHSSRMAEICRRMRQLAEDMESMLGEDEAESDAP